MSCLGRVGAVLVLLLTIGCSSGPRGTLLSSKSPSPLPSHTNDPSVVKTPPLPLRYTATLALAHTVMPRTTTLTSSPIPSSTPAPISMVTRPPTATAMPTKTPTPRPAATARGRGTPVLPPDSTPEARVEDQVAQLAFVSDRRQRGNLDIWLYDLPTGQAYPLTADDWQDASPAWSPDGRVLVFYSFRVGGRSTIRAVTLPDRTVHDLVPPEYKHIVTDFTWSGSGRSIFYTTFTELGENDALWQLDLQTGAHSRIGDVEALISISHDDRYLAFATREPEYNWLVFRVVQLSDNAVFVPAEEQFHPFMQRWAPREDTLAVVSGLGPQVAIYQVSSRGIEKKAADLASNNPEMRLCDLAWSPDGREILVVHAPLTSNVCQGELLLYDAGLAHRQLLSLEGLAGYAGWSKDGKWIAYGRNDTLNVGQYQSNTQWQASGEIWIVDHAGLGARPLITGPAYNGQPAWRP